MLNLEIATSAATEPRAGNLERFSALVWDRMIDLHVERLLKSDLIYRLIRQTSWLASLEPDIKKLQKQVSLRFKQMDAEVRAKLNNWPKGVARATRKDFSVEDYLFSQRKYGDTLTQDVRNLTTEPLLSNGNRVMNELDTGVSFDQTDPRVLEFLATNSKNAGFNITETQYNKLRAVLLKGQTEGWNIKKIRRLIAEKLDMAYRRAELIARTEVLKSANEGSYRAFVQSGVVEGVQWDAAIDKRTCPMCAQMDTATMPLGKPFFEQGEIVTFTGTEEVTAPKGEMVYAFDYETVTHPPLHPD